VATVSRIDKITGLFCKRDLWKRRYSAKETYHFIDPTDCSHPISPLPKIRCIFCILSQKRLVSSPLHQTCRGYICVLYRNEDTYVSSTEMWISYVLISVEDTYVSSVWCRGEDTRSFLGEDTEYTSPLHQTCHKRHVVRKVEWCTKCITSTSDMSALCASFNLVYNVSFV